MEDMLSGIVNDKRRVKNQLGETTNDVQPVYKRFNNYFDITSIAIKGSIENLDGVTLVWGSSTQGTWGEYNWGADATVLSTAFVIPSQNLFVEYFVQDTFIDTNNSTGTLDTTNETYTLTSGDILQSTIISKRGEPIIRALFKSHDDINTTNSIIYLSNDGGVNWHSVTPGTVFTFPSNGSDDELLYKIEATSGYTISNKIRVKVNP